MKSVPAFASFFAVLLLGAGQGHAQPFMEGIDVSRWQGHVDWNAVYQSGVDFAFIKATEGVGFTDPRFQSNMAGATAAGVLTGPYHFARIDSGTHDPLDPVHEANYFLSAIQPYYDAGLHLPPVADVEGLPDFPTVAQERAFISNWVQIFSDTIHNALGVRPLIYTSKFAANTYYTPQVATDHDLWLAWWRGTGTSNPPVSSDTPLWNDWVFWQWTDSWSVPGISGNVDGDVFDGTRQELEQLLIGNGSVASNPIVTVTDFEIDEGYFNWSPFYSGSNTGILEGTTSERVTTEAQEGHGSQRIVVDGDPNGWLLRHLSGIGSPVANPASNLALEPAGYVGFWLKTDDPGVRVQLALDDPETADRGATKDVIADGDWHLYEWNLEDNSQWEAWVHEEGIITGPVVTFDSIQFRGHGDVTLYLDSVAHNPLGSLLVTTGDYNGDGAIDAADYTVWQDSLGSSTDLRADGSGNGLIDLEDYEIWTVGAGGMPGVDPLQTSSVPEPAAIVLWGIAAAWLIGNRKKGLLSSE